MFDYLSNVVLRNLNPRMYDTYSIMHATDKYVGHWEDPDAKPLCGAWFGCAINKGQDINGTPHKDRSDYAMSHNCVVG